MIKNIKQFFFITGLLLIAAGAQPVGAAIWQWSTTAASNATADPTINWSEGMSPSSVNDSARAMMAVVAEWRNDISRAGSTGGTGTAYTLTTSEGASSPVDKQMLAFYAHVSNTGAATLAADGGSPAPIFANGAALPAGTLLANTPYRVIYNASATRWDLEGLFGNPYNLPIGAYLFSSLTTAPNSNFLIANGQCISRTIYAAYFSAVGTSYGSCDGLTTFAVPDMRGRVPAMLDGGANRLTATACGGAFNSLGVTCGSQTYTLLTANLPPYTPAGFINGSVTMTAVSLIHGSSFNPAAPAAWTDPNGSALGTFAPSITHNLTFAGSSQGGSSTPFPNVQPTLGVQVFVRVL